MDRLRLPAVAGRFYPGDPSTLATQLDALLQEYPAPPIPHLRPRAIIAPHAGYVFSGPTAARAYNAVRAQRPEIIFLLGPAHRVPVKGLALPAADRLRTPLGDLPIASDCTRDLLERPGISESAEVHAEEHSLEVHLPFIQSVFSGSAVVPLAIGHASREEVSAVLEIAFDIPQSLTIISSDLSHFHAYHEANRIDRKTANKMESLDATLNGKEACGFKAINGLLFFAQQNSWELRTLDLCNSGDTNGPRDRVVGYGAFVAGEAA